MRRWTIRITVAFVLALAAAALILYVVLRTDLPGEYILRAVSDKLGMEVTADSLSVRWTGKTTIRNATVKMLLSDEAFLSVDEIEISHTAVPFVLFNRSVSLRAVRIDSPTLRLRQDRTGHWNARDIWTRLRAGIDSGGRQNHRARLPQLGVRRAVLEITDPNGISQTVGPLSVQGASERGSLWAFTLGIGPGVEAKGRLVQDGQWTHRIDFNIKDMGTLIPAMLGRDLSSAQVAGRWEGAVAENTLTGRIRFDKLELAGATMQGAVRVNAHSDGLTLSPEDFVLSEPNLLGESLRFAAGSVHIGNDEVKVEQLAGRVGQLTAELNSRWNWDARIGEFSGSWAGKLPGDDFQCQGTYQVALKSPRFGRKEAQLNIKAEAQTAVGAWSVIAKTQANGGNWQESRWQTSVPTFTWSRGVRQIDMSGAAAEIACNWPDVRLTALHLPDADKIAAKAGFHANTRDWSVRIDAKGLHPKGRGGDPVDFVLNAEGGSRKTTISEFRLTEGERSLTAKGDLSVADNEIRGVEVSAEWPAHPDRSDKAKAAKHAGRWRYEANIVGRIQPVQLKVTGALSGRSVLLGKQTVDQVDIAMRADVDPERIDVATEPFSLLGGRWQINGRQDLSSQVTQLSLTVDDLSLKAAADMAGSPLKCGGQARAQLQLAVPRLEVQEAVASGNWSASGIVIPPFEAGKASGKLRISGGLVRFDEIQLEQEQGRAQGSMQFGLDRPQRLSIAFKTQAWPVRPQKPPMELLVNSEADLQLDVLTKAIDGRGRLSGTVLWKNEDFGSVTLSASVEQRTLEVQEFRAQTLGGLMEGTARIPLDRWTSTTGRLQWHEIQPGFLERWWPDLAAFDGRLSGVLTARQTSEQPRALEPMRLELSVQCAEGRFGRAQIGDCNALAYLGEERLLIDRSSLHLLGGRVDLRARVSSHMDGFYASVATDCNNLNLDQLVHVLDPNADEFPGRLSGKVTALASSERISLGGEADLVLTESDLVNNGAVRTLYDTLKLKSAGKKPTGTGRIKVLLEGRAVKISSFTYFNRGVEIRGAGQVEDVSLGVKSPVQGYAVGSTRVLKDIRLPGVRELDRLMASFQTGVASVRIKGTLGQTEVNVVPLPAVSSPLRRLLWSQLRE